VDFGSKRIGMAVGDSVYRLTSALPTIAASGTLAIDAKVIGKAAAAESAEAVVVGVPKNVPGLSDRMERICLQLVERLKDEGLQVFTVDESFSSLEGEQLLARSTRSRRREKLDGEAARVILERFFAAE
jgi:putative transcription antitermination factor YqgF